MKCVQHLVDPQSFINEEVKACLSDETQIILDSLVEATNTTSNLAIMKNIYGSMLATL